MKALFISIGTRGDVEPFLAIANILRQKGWENVCVFPEQLRDLVEEEGYRFYGFNKEFMDIFIKGEEGKKVVGGEGSIFKSIGIMMKMMKKILQLTREINELQFEVTQDERPDYIFYHFKCIYPLIWGIQFPGKSIMVSPFPCTVHPVTDHSIIGFRGGGNYGAFINRFTFAWQNFFKSIVFYFSMKRFAKQQGIKISPGLIRKKMLKEEKTIYPNSPTLFPRPKDWPLQVKVTGHIERPKSKHYIPEENLSRFIQQHPKILFISFGSISGTNPEEKSRYILQVIAKHNIPTIINTSWGGLVKPEQYPDHIYFVERIPYEWILPKVYAMIHHGGAGTTHSALRFACASLIIPHFIDQFFWARKVVDLGAGPEGMAIKHLKEDNFEKALLELWNNSSYKEQAKWVAKQMETESNEEELMELIQR